MSAALIIAAGRYGDARIAQLQAKLGEVTMDNEMLQEKIMRLESGRPLVRRRSEP